MSIGGSRMSTRSSSSSVDAPVQSLSVETRSISKSFPGVRALHEVSLTIQAGAVHGLVGENGAGKSTLGKILSGLHQPDSGEILLGGRRVVLPNPHAAMRIGVGIVHQELSFCENLTIAENLCLDDLPHRGPFVDWSAMRERARSWLEAVGVDVDPDQVVGRLSIGQQQLVQIAGAIGRGARVIVFDEPTSSLTKAETEVLFRQIERLKASGVTSVYVTHRMEEIFQICDAVSVLRDGVHVDTQPIGQLDRAAIVRLMIGRELEPTPDPPKQLGEVALRVKGLKSPGKLEGVSLEVREGEVVGLAGLIGSGRTEIVSAVFGLDPLAEGGIEINGRNLKRYSPRNALRLGAGFVPEDRKRQGLVLSMNCKENLTLAILKRLSALGFIRGFRERSLAKDYFQKLNIRAPSIHTGVSSLSGGNQQKVILARWLAAGGRLLLLDEPTRGVDVGAKAEIHSLIRQLASQGIAVLAISSELPELMAISDRILVVRNGRIVGEQTSAECTEESLMTLMAGAG